MSTQTRRRRLRASVAICAIVHTFASLASAQAAEAVDNDSPAASAEADDGSEPPAAQSAEETEPAVAAEDEPVAPAKAALPAKPAPRPGEDPQLARVLFEEGRRLVQQDRLEEACSTFEKSLRFQTGVGIKFNLADCWERIGSNAKAFTLFRQVAEESASEGQPERERVARDRAQALLPKVSLLQIDVASTEPGLELTRNGVVLPTSELGEAVAVEPGTFEIAAAAPGKRSWSVKLLIPAAPGTTVVTVPALKDKSAPLSTVEKTPSKAVSHRAHEAAPAPSPSAENRSAATQRTVAFVVGGVGVAALATGGWMALRYRAANDDAEQVCRTSVNCTAGEIERHQDLVDDAKAARTFAFVGAGVGAGALAVASYLFVRSLSSDSKLGDERELAKARLLPVPVIGVDGSVGAVFSGTF